MGNDKILDLAAIETRFLDKAFACLLLGCRNYEILAVGQMENSPAEERRAKHVLGRARIERIESKGREYVPCRHLPAIVVAGITAWSGIIERAAHLVHQLLRLVGPACKVIQVYGMVTRLVAMGILPDESACIAVDLSAGGSQGEILVEFADERVVSTEQFD